MNGALRQLMSVAEFLARFDLPALI